MYESPCMSLVNTELQQFSCPHIQFLPSGGGGGGGINVMLSESPPSLNVLSKPFRSI